MGDGVNIAARLEGIAKPGAICLSEDAYRQVKGRLDLVVRDLGKPSSRTSPSRYGSIRSKSAGPRRRSLPPAWRRKNATPRLSIVVLPFANLGGDPETGAFRRRRHREPDTTDLSRIRGSFVIGRNTAFTYKGKPLDLKQIGRESNVRYVLEGSVQRGGNRMRVNVQLIDAETGNHLWAERFDKPVADLFDMQDEIVSRLANTLNAQLSPPKRDARNRPRHPDSMDLYFQGGLANKGVTPENLMQARIYFRTCAPADPDNVEALIGTACADAIEAPVLYDRSARCLQAAEAS